MAEQFVKALVLVVGFTLPAAAEQIPKYDIDNTCQKISEATADAVINRSETEALCRKREVKAASTLRTTSVSRQILHLCMNEDRRLRWSTYSELNKCVQIQIYIKRGMGTGDPIPNYSEYCQLIEKIDPDSLDVGGCHEREAQALAALTAMNIKPEIIHECNKFGREDPEYYGYVMLNLCIKRKIAAQTSASHLGARH